MNEAQRKKTKFRSSKKWKLFQKQVHQLQHGYDPITNSKLRKYANVHHLDLDAAHYEDLSNPDHFIYVNHNTHKWIHEIYTYYKKDRGVLQRLQDVLDRMIEINGGTV